MAEAKKPRRKPPGPKRKPGQPKRGPLPWVPTAEQRLMVEVAVANGFTHDQIGLLLGKSRESIETHCAEELANGNIKAGVKISTSLMQKAMKGDIGAIVWWEKTRRGMKDQSRTEHTGANGGPIEYRDLSDEEVEARIAAIVAGDGPSVTTH